MKFKLMPLKRTKKKGSNCRTDMKSKKTNCHCRLLKSEGRHSPGTITTVLGGCDSCGVQTSVQAGGGSGNSDTGIGDSGKSSGVRAPYTKVSLDIIGGRDEVTTKK